MKGFISATLAIVVGLALLGTGFFATLNYIETIGDELLGATLFVTASPTKLGGSGVAATDTTVNLVKLRTPADNKVTMTNFGDIGFGTIEPARTNKEFISFTGVTQNADGTATLTGVTRGLNFVSPYTASSTLRKSHPGGAGFVISNPPQLLDSLISKQTDSFVTSTVTFSVSAFPRMSASSTNPTNDTELVHKFYVDSVAIAGVPDGNYTTFGGFVLATTSQIIAGTATSTVTRYLVVPSELTNATSSAKPLIPVTGSDGKLSQGFLDLTDAFTFTGGVTSTGALVVSGNTTLSITNIDGVLTVSTSSIFTAPVSGIAFGGNGSDGVLTATATIFDLTSSSTKTFNFSSLSITGTSTITFTNPHDGGTLVIFKISGNANIACSSAPCIDLQGMGSATSTNPNFTLDTGTGYIGISGTRFSGERYVSSTLGMYTDADNLWRKWIAITPGAAGGDGVTSLLDGGRGGGAFLMEVGGTLTFTVANGIRTAGENGENGDGPGGGGAGAPCLILYNIGSPTGTCNDAGGNGGTGSGDNDGGGGGGSLGGLGGDGDTVNSGEAGGGANWESAGANGNVGGAGAPSTGGIIVKNNGFF